LEVLFFIVFLLIFISSKKNNKNKNKKKKLEYDKDEQMNTNTKTTMTSNKEDEKETDILNIKASPAQLKNNQKLLQSGSYLFSPKKSPPLLQTPIDFHGSLPTSLNTSYSSDSYFFDSSSSFSSSNNSEINTIFPKINSVENEIFYTYPLGTK
jgi:hypothetical protein